MKNTNRALFSSVVALILCCSMLVGSTFAWFTDEVKSGVNQIVAGNLDVDVLTADGNSIQGVETLFDDVTLWEPGVVAYENLTVVNNGNLALKYELAISFANENTVNGKGLSSALKVALVNSKVAAGLSRENVLALAGEGVNLSSFNRYDELDKGESKEYTLIIWWAPSANDNDWNVNNGKTTSDGKPLHIDLGVKLVATQKMAEEDSFGPEYDKDALAIDVSWYDPAKTEYVLNTAAELRGLAAIVNGTAPADATVYSLRSTTAADSFAGKTVKLGADVDLKNAPWTPIGSWDNAFEGTFDGQGYTISNLYINAPTVEGVGLFGVAQNAAIKGINVHNVDIVGYSMVATVVGSPYTGCTVSDCHVTGKISLTADWAYVGGVLGYGYTKVENCSVIADGTGVIVSKTRNAVGGIAAWLLEDASSIKNCQVKNLELTGWANIGAITGFMHRLGVIDNCSAENVVLTKTRLDGIATVGLAAGGYNYNASKAITITNNTFKNITLNGTYVANAGADILYGGEYYGNTNTNFVLDNNVQENITNNMVEVIAITNEASLKSAFENGGNIVLTSDVSLGENDSIVIPAGVTATLDLNGHTISQNKTQTGAYALIDNNGTLTINDSVGTGKISYADTGAGGEYASNTISNKGTLTVNGGTVENTSSDAVKSAGYPHAIDCYQGSVTNITGGTVKSVNYDAIRMFCNSETLATTVNISGGTIFNRVSFQDPAASRAGYGRLNISGGTFITTEGITSNVRLLNFSNVGGNMKAVVTGGTFDKGFQTRDYVNAGVKMSDWLSYKDADMVIPGTTITLNKADRNQDGGIIHLNNENDIWYLNTLIEEWDTLTGTVGHDHYYYRSAWQVVLHCDVDLENKPWTPVNLGLLGGFDGQNHTISNLNVTGTDSVGLFSSTLNNDSGSCYISNLVIDGATVTGETKVGVVVGYSPAPITNVTVKKATVTADKYAGIIAGKAGSNFVDCSVIDSSITATDKEIGGLVGFLDVADSNPGATYTVEVKGCEIQNVTVKGTEEVGGLIGRAYARYSTTIAISGNTVNATVTATLGTYTDTVLGRNYGGNITIA